MAICQYLVLNFTVETSQLISKKKLKFETIMKSAKLFPMSAWHWKKLIYLKFKNSDTWKAPIFDIPVPKILNWIQCNSRVLKCFTIFKSSCLLSKKFKLCSKSFITLTPEDTRPENFHLSLFWSSWWIKMKWS